MKQNRNLFIKQTKPSNNMPLPFCTCSVFKCIYCFHSHKRFNTKVKDYSGSLLLITNISVLLCQQIHNALAIHKASLKSNSLIFKIHHLSFVPSPRVLQRHLLLFRECKRQPMYIYLENIMQTHDQFKPTFPKNTLGPAFCVPYVFTVTQWANSYC